MKLTELIKRKKNLLSSSQELFCKNIFNRMMKKSKSQTILNTSLKVLIVLIFNPKKVHWRDFDTLTQFSNPNKPRSKKYLPNRFCRSPKQKFGHILATLWPSYDDRLSKYFRVKPVGKPRAAAAAAVWCRGNLILLHMHTHTHTHSHIYRRSRPVSKNPSSAELALKTRALPSEVLF